VILNLFKAFKKLKHKYKNIFLALAGPRNFNIPVDDNIIDMGILKYDDVPIFLNTLDLAIICNIKNKFGEFCFPQKANEIMACDIPLISANVGSMKILFSEFSDWLYQWDSVENLTQPIINRLNNTKTNYQNVQLWNAIAEKIKIIIKQNLS
jgi:glycosyltransferase involved in cell wall biosynthesis